MAAAKLVGLIEAGQEHGYRLSDLGLETIDQNHMRAAGSQAFVIVPLFKRVYENWRGQLIPPPAALERAMLDFGVARKQTARARQTLERSATTANFFEQGRDRLVQPAIKSPSSGEQNIIFAGGGGSDDPPPPPELDPIIKGLIEKLPRSGSVWPRDKRKQWLTVLENIFELVYEDRPEKEGESKDRRFAIYRKSHRVNRVGFP